MVSFLPRHFERLARRSASIRKLTKSDRRKTKAFQVFLPFLLLTTTSAVANSFDLRKGRIITKRREFDLSDHIIEIGEDLFKRLYRVDVRQFKQLCDLLKPHLERRHNRTGPGATKGVKTMLCTTLRILAGASYLDVRWPYGVARSTTYTIFYETLEVLNKVLPAIRFPVTNAECREKAQQFRSKRRSPLYGIVAALDGIAITISQPKISETPDPRKYYNRKGFFALCVQVAVGADYKFLFVSARHAGGTHDSTAFQATQLHEFIERGVLPSWAKIAADDAYVNGDYTLTPYGGYGLSQEQDAFNLYLSSCRMAVEQAFGMLVSRFGIFWSPLRFGLAKYTLILMVACKLHNFIIESGDLSYFDSLEVADENNVAGKPVVYLQNDLHTEQHIQRSRQRRRENSSLRDSIASRLSLLGLIRPRTRR